MLAVKRVFRADPRVDILADAREVAPGDGVEGQTNLWADSVGEAMGQLGLVVTLAIVARFAMGLLSDLVTAL
jgi:hypothetical protein